MRTASRETLQVSYREAGVLLSRWLLVATLLTIVALVLGYLVGGLLPARFRAETELLVAPGVSGATNLTLPMLETPPLPAFAYETALVSAPVLRDAYDATTGSSGSASDDLATLRGAIHAHSVTDPSSRALVLKIDVTSVDPVFAAQLANQLGRALVSWDSERLRVQLREDRAAVGTAVSGASILEKDAQQWAGNLDVALRMVRSSLLIIQAAEPPTRPVWQPRIVMAAILVFLAWIVAAAIVSVRRHN